MMTVIGFSGHFCAETGAIAPAMNVAMRERTRGSLRIRFSCFLCSRACYFDPNREFQPRPEHVEGRPRTPCRGSTGSSLGWLRLADADGFERAVDELEPVLTPEQLALEHEGRRTEHAELL